MSLAARGPLDSLCRKVQIDKDVLLRASRRLAQVLVSFGVDLDPNRTVSEQAKEACDKGIWWGCWVRSALDLVDPGHVDRQPVMRPAGVSLMHKWAGGLTGEMVSALDSLAFASGLVGLPDPRTRIISGYRDPSHQAALQDAWDRGNREGLVTRPANPETSRHTTGTAVDLSGTDEELSAWAEIWEGMGFRWGGRFFPRRDAVHYDLG